jgi:8-oxo-dGTP pyrophosphatase MutT (NUDIX family)
MSDYVRGLRERVGHDLLFHPAAACLVRDEHGRVLLVQHVEGHWTLPAGGVDPGETPAEAARREAREETTLEVEIVGLAGVFGGYPDFHRFYANGDEVAWVAIVFDARIVAGEPRRGDDETADVRWVSSEDALALELSESTRHILAAVADGRAFDP